MPKVRSFFRNGIRYFEFHGFEVTDHMKISKRIAPTKCISIVGVDTFGMRYRIH